VLAPAPQCVKLTRKPRESGERFWSGDSCQDTASAVSKLAVKELAASAEPPQQPKGDFVAQILGHA
jgi:hypothetical protein